MRGAFKLGEKLIQSSAMAMPDDLVMNVTTSMSFGTLSLTNGRLVFEPDLLSIRAEERDIPLADIEGVEADWTKLFKYLPVYPTLQVTTKDGRKHRFAVTSFGGVGPKRWIEAIKAARATARVEMPTSAAEDGEQAASHFYQNGGVKIGPLTRQEFDYNCSMGKIAPDTPAWAGSGDWRPASSFTTFADMPAVTQQVLPPPLPVNDHFVWVIVAVPIVGTILELLVGRNLVYAYLMANGFLCLYDAKLLKAGGHESPDTWWALLVPGYLWKRAKLLKQSPIFTWIWVAAFVGSLFLANAGSNAAIEAGACPLVTQIIQQQLSASATCKGVSIVKDVGDGFYTATATLDNGNDIRITIQQRGKHIYVQVPRQ